MACYQCKQQYCDSYEGPARSLKAAGEVMLGILAVESSLCPAILHFPPPGIEHDFVFKGFWLADV